MNDIVKAGLSFVATAGINTLVGTAGYVVFERYTAGMPLSLKTFIWALGLIGVTSLGYATGIKTNEFIEEHF